MRRAATDLLIDSGPRSVTVDAVAERSGVAKSTLYRHWSSRTELLVDVIRCSYQSMPTLDLSEGFEISLRTMVVSAAMTFADSDWRQIFPSMASLRISIPEVDAFFEQDIDEKKASLAAILDLGVDEGMLPVSVDVNDASGLLIGPVIFTTMTQPSVAQSVDDLVRLANYAVDRFIASYR